jgi:hypothetical protein
MAAAPSGRPDRPILFLAFANDRTDAPEHLRNLAAESRRLRRTLKAAPYAHTYTVEHEDRAQLDDIHDCFQQHRVRVAIFHFGDHADSYQLLTKQTGVDHKVGAKRHLATVQKLAGHTNANTTARYDRRGERAKLHVPWSSHSAH